MKPAHSFRLIKIDEIRRSDYSTSNGKYLIPGAIFHDENPDIELSFRFAIDRFNLYNSDYHINPIIHRIPNVDSFKIGQAGKQTNKVLSHVDKHIV